MRPRFEKAAAKALRNKGYREFLPLYRCRRCWGRRTVELDLPLFPGYLFCRLDLGDRRVPILTAPGVLQFVGFGGTPAPVDPGEIAALHRIVECGVVAEPWRYLAAGSRVRIADGALAGLEGVLIEVKKRQRLVLSVTLLQRSVVFDIDSFRVAPLAPGWRGEVIRLASEGT